jgi:transposase-like protein
VSPKKRRYTEDFKKQVILECQETGNNSLVARRHNIHISTLNGWLKRYKETGSVTGTSVGTDTDVKVLTKHLNQITEENDRLKRLMAEKDLKISILEDLMKKSNPLMPTRLK